MSYQIQQDVNGYSFFNIEHYIQVRKEREKRGLTIKSSNGEKIDHHLIGKQFFHEEKNYKVDYAVKQWHWGYYITLALVDDNKSHRCIMWESLGTGDQTILESIEENRKEFSFLLEE